jgi:MFS family permease
MIADTLDKSPEQILTVFEGVIAGTAAVILSMALGFGLFMVQSFFENICRVNLTFMFFPRVLILVCAGAFFGLLFAISSRRSPGRYLIGLGIFYGLELWILCFFFSYVFQGICQKELIKTWPIAGLFIFYGVFLALIAAFKQIKLPPVPPREPRD